MATLNISLPDSMRDFVMTRLDEGGFSTASEYVRDLIREDQKRADQQRLEQLLLEGLDSGPFIEFTDEWWEQKKAEMLSRLRDRRET